MRIVVHAGLHKSGTTTIQESWKRAYGDHPDVWYPRPDRGPPGHHRLVRPLLSAFIDGTAADLAGVAVGFRERGARSRRTLADVVAQAREQDVGTLLLSTEFLDRATESDVPRLTEAFGGEPVTVVLTATRPVHRWCSGWQTLVKHGLAEYPYDARRHVLDFAALQPGRLAALARLLPGSRRVVRLVRHTPTEPTLAADLARGLGLPDAETAVAPQPLNASLGVETEVVLRLNRADLALGTDHAGADLLRRLRGDGFSFRDAPDLTPHYRIPQAVSDAAAAEVAWLTRPGDVEVWDPHDLVSTWTDPTPPGWYDTISRREAVVADLDTATSGAEDRETQLWRARQEREAYRKLARRG